MMRWLQRTRNSSLVLALVLALGSYGCASVQPPAGTYTTAGLKAFNGDETLKALTALSQTAVNLNATTGREHLTDRDTALVRDFALSAGDGVLAYSQGRGTLATVLAGFQTLTETLSREASVNEKLRFVLAIVSENLHRIPAQ